MQEVTNKQTERYENGKRKQKTYENAKETYRKHMKTEKENIQKTYGNAKKKKTFRKHM